MEKVFWQNQKRMEHIEQLVENLVRQLSEEEQQFAPSTRQCKPDESSSLDFQQWQD